MDKFDDIDPFTDPSLVEDPYPYFEHLRAQCPVQPLGRRNVIAVTGFEEAIPIYNNPKTFSSVIAVGGPIPPLPFKPETDDISAQLEEYRGKMPMTEQVVAMDDERHTVNRGLLMRLFTPSRLAANEAFIRQVVDELLDPMVAKTSCEFFREFGHPFATLVIADLLGVPEADRQLFMEALADGAPPSSIDEDEPRSDFFQFVGKYFYQYVEDRRRNPRDDILSELATAKYPDGSTPSAMDIVNLAAFLFGAGQDTTAKLVATSLRILSERPELQDTLRNDNSLIPEFVEEVLRFDGPVKTSFRLARQHTTVGGVDVPAGTCLMMVNPAFNRDPRKFEDPQEFKLGRPRSREHLAFGRGAHTCAGAPLARTEARIGLERILERLRNIRLSDEKHGPAGARKFDYEPTYILRGLSRLYLEYTPAP